jgi:hypothetical protein
VQVSRPSVTDGRQAEALELARQPAHHKTLELDFVVPVVDIDANEIACVVMVEHDTIGLLAALDARALREVDGQ